jgi:hypothetical protein
MLCHYSLHKPNQIRDGGEPEYSTLKKKKKNSNPSKTKSGTVVCGGEPELVVAFYLPLFVSISILFLCSV